MRILKLEPGSLIYTSYNEVFYLVISYAYIPSENPYESRLIDALVVFKDFPKEHVKLHQWDVEHMSKIC